MTVTANEHVLGEVLGWGGACQVVAPADVRDALQRRIAALQSIYRLIAYAPEGVSTPGGVATAPRRE